jgi:4-amino-4-deoxy-L-arabinose transferase-like glycosyltransferase
MRIQIDRPVKYLSEQWEKQPILAWTASAVWILLICWLAFWWNLGNIGLIDETEPLFAEAARQMTLTGDWITPYFNGATRFDKPPLVYWLMAIGYQTIGVNEWSVRLPSALSAIGLTIFSFITLRRFGYPSPAAVDRRRQTIDRQRWTAAWIGAALVALNAQTIVWARTGVSDMLLSGCIGATLLCFFWGYAQPSQPQVQVRWYLAFYMFSALAVLTKGPVGIVLPGLVIGSFLLYLGNAKVVLREMNLLRGSLLFLLLVLPWYVLVIQANGWEYINAFFGYHNIERFTSVVNNHAAPWFFYFVVVLLGFAPWSVYLPAAIGRLQFWQRSHWQQQPRPTHLGIFALMWFTAIFGFFTIAVTKLPSYVLPLMPAAAILIGLLWSDLMTRRQLPRSVLVSAIVNLGFLIGLAGAVAYSANWMGDDPAMPDLPQAVRQANVLVWGSAIWATAAVVGVALLLRQQGRWLWLINLVGFAAFIGFTIVPASLLMDAQRQLPLRQLSATIGQIQQPQEEVVMVGFEKPSLVFYSQRPITYLSHPDRTIGYLRRKYALCTPPCEQTAIPASALVLGYPEKLEETRLRPNQYETIAQFGAYELIRVPLPIGGRRR